MGPLHALTGLLRLGGDGTTPREADSPDEGSVYYHCRRPDVAALRSALEDPSCDLSACDKYGLFAIHHAARAGNAQAIDVRNPFCSRVTSTATGGTGPAAA
jgi:hypothetical protein